jgi:hypothetical protein
MVHVSSRLFPVRPGRADSDAVEFRDCMRAIANTDCAINTPKTIKAIDLLIIHTSYAIFVFLSSTTDDNIVILL